MKKPIQVTNYGFIQHLILNITNSLLYITLYNYFLRRYWFLFVCLNRALSVCRHISQYFMYPRWYIAIAYLDVNIVHQSHQSRAKWDFKTPPTCWADLLFFTTMKKERAREKNVKKLNSIFLNSKSFWF